VPATLLGADADELERIAHEMRAAADELDGHAGSLTTALRSVAWVGGVATRFGARWDGGHRPRMAMTAQSVRDAATRLDRNAAEQRLASRAGVGSLVGIRPTAPIPAPLPTQDPSGAEPAGPSHPGDGGAGGSSSSVDAPGSHVLDRIGEILDVVGVNRDVLDVLADHADLLDGPGVDRLIGILSNDGFLAVLEGLDRVLDVGSTVVDLIGDFVEHPHLPFDDRVVHALADAGARFGIDQGVEHAATFLAQAATAALLPGLGAALAPFAGTAAGLIATVVVGEITDLVDGATDFADVVADAAVEAYRSAREAFGVIVDAAGVVVDVADAAIDLTVDTAGVVVDVGAVAVDGVVDVGGAVAGGIADAGSTFGAWLGL